MACKPYRKSTAVNGRHRLLWPGATAPEDRESEEICAICGGEREIDNPGYDGVFDFRDTLRCPECERRAWEEWREWKFDEKRGN